MTALNIQENFYRFYLKMSLYELIDFLKRTYNNNINTFTRFIKLYFAKNYRYTDTYIETMNFCIYYKY